MKILLLDNLISSIIIRALSGISNLSWIWDAGVTPTVTPARELDDKNSSTNLPAPIVIPNLPIRLQKVEYQSILNNFYSKRIIQRILQSMSFLIKYNLNSHWAQRLDVSSYAFDAFFTPANYTRYTSRLLLLQQRNMRLIFDSRRTMHRPRTNSLRILSVLSCPIQSRNSVINRRHCSSVLRSF